MTRTEIGKVTVSKRSGAYNLLDPRQQSWRLALRVEGIGGVDVGFGEDEPDDVTDVPPSEIAGIIKEKLAKLWINTSRVEDNRVCDEVIARAEEVDGAWAMQQSAQLHGQAGRLIARADALERANPMPTDVSGVPSDAP
jgi:hypothetical protein